MSEVRFPAARNHPVLHAAPTFRPISKGRRRRGLERIHETENGTLKVRMFFELDVADQDLLLCVLAIARSEIYREAVDQDDKILEALELDLNHGKVNEKCVFSLLELPALKVSITRYELLKELQKTDGSKNYKWLKESLDRLSVVNFKYDGTLWSGSFNLLSFRLNKETYQYDIFINPISAHSIWSKDSSYIYTNRTERLSLKQDTARVLHNYLSGVVRVKETRTVAIGSMISHVFVLYNDEVKADAQRYQRKQICDAAREINQTLAGWIIKISGRGKTTRFTITRLNQLPY